MFLKYLNLILVFSSSSLQSCWETNQADHVAKVPAPRIVRYLAECVSVKHEFEPVLRPLLTTRIPDTQGSEDARQYIIKTLTDLGWTVELSTWSQETVVGVKTFNNIIATRNINSPRRLGTSQQRLIYFKIRL